MTESEDNSDSFMVPFQDDSITLELFTKVLSRIKVSEDKTEITTIKMSVDTICMAADDRLRVLDLQEKAKEAGIDKDEVIHDHHTQPDKDKERERLDNLNQ